MVYLPESRGTSELHPDKTPGWNELHFMNREEFARMVPTVLQLEVSRLGMVLTRFEPGTDAYNAVVTARHRVGKLREGLQSVLTSDEVADHERDLETAIMSVSIRDEDVPRDVQRELVYVADRLVYILGQMRLLY